MKTPFLAIGTLLFLGPVSYVSARVNGQFETFYPGYYDKTLKAIFATNCSREYNGIFKDGDGGYWAVKCALEYISEIKKAETAASSVILGLLPVAMQLIGPKIGDICILALRRPLLALLLTLGSPCATMDHDRTGLEIPSRAPDKDPLWPKHLKRPTIWVKALISIVEYVLVGLAVGNSLLQGYQLTFWAISLVSTSLGTFGHTMEAVSPIVWIFLSVPIHFLGMCSLRLSQKRAKDRESAASGVSSRRQRPSSKFERIKELMTSEFTPCAYQHRCVEISRAIDPSYPLLILDWVTRLCTWTQLIMGIIVLSTVLFVSLWETLRIVGRFLVGSIVCRVVLAFEIYSYQEISNGRHNRAGGEVASLTT